jgi:hypothetical protein
MRRSIPQSIFALLAAPVLMFATSASAAPSADSCGNIALVATGDCHLDVTGGCDAKCEPLSFQAACDGKCDVAIDATCDVDCKGSCNADCTVDPGSIDCSARCEADCGASCDGSCSAQSDKASCTGYCQESCKGTCQGQCKVVAPTAECTAKCDASCQGSCSAKANFDCSFKCTADIQGGCKADCTAPDGALFCTDQNGRDQYVHVTNLADCEAYLLSSFNVKVQASASGSCDANGCTGTGTAGIGCSTVPVGSAPFDVGAIATMAMGLGLVISRRRRS